ncbi:hypothetical protein [Thalassotalea profundi]|uniref:DUF4488 domain-containing protein n=1 Tax=Thalassotalea profundi TaxID=2036687 RepID=A0ABQ3INL0_9GAMM|nr:hypothetical protein [Thalassotalea profundi]GHE87581.1 hypothetical protein GCM10011501_16350 [Thalassotalea profundi]
MYKYLSLLFIFISITCFASNNPFLGTWQLVSGEYLNDKQVMISYDSLGLSSQKIINEQHFSFVSMANGKFWAAGTGTYTYNEKEYFESPKMASYPLESGGVYTFKYKIQDNLWHNERWHNNIRVEYEIWQKVVK